MKLFTKGNPHCSDFLNIQLFFCIISNFANLRNIFEKSKFSEDFPKFKKFKNNKFFSNCKSIFILNYSNFFYTGMTLVQSLTNTPQWSQVDAKLVDTQFPGCEKFKLKSLPYYECVAQHFTLSIGNIGQFLKKFIKTVIYFKYFKCAKFLQKFLQKSEH